MWRTLRHLFVKRSGNSSTLRLGQIQAAEKNEDCRKQPDTENGCSERTNPGGKALVQSNYDLADENFQDGFNLIRILIRNAERQERKRVARLRSLVGGERENDSSSCGNFIEEIKLWCGGVLALSSIICCKSFVLDDNNRFDITKLPHVVYYILFPRPQAALAILPVVTSGQQQALKETSDNTLDRAIASFESEFSECAAATQNKLGVKFAAAKEHNKACALFQLASNQGHTLAQFNLGLCFEHGKGTEKDLTKAAECYKSAAALGHGGALYNLALFYMDGIGGLPKSETRALELLQLAAQTGMDKAQSYLGIYYADELSDHVDYHKAFSYLEQAAAKKDAAAEYHIGVCYERGLAVEQDMTKAGHMYKSSARHGNTSAQYNMGVFYEHGLGDFPVDKDEALRYYRMAAETGDEDAKHNYNLLKLKITPDVPPPKKARLFNENSILLALIQGLSVNVDTRDLTANQDSINRCASSPNLVGNKEIQSTNLDTGNPLIAF